MTTAVAKPQKRRLGGEDLYDIGAAFDCRLPMSLGPV